MIESAPAFRNRLSTKLIVAVVAFLLLLTAAVLLVVDFNLRKTGANASSLSSNGLLTQGEVSLLKITVREAELSNRLLHRAAIMTQVAADYMAESQAANSLEAVAEQYPGLVWRADQLARREDGTFYDPNPRRRSDIYIPSLGSSDDETDRILRQSAPLDLLFPTLLAQSPDAVNIFYQDTVQHITRHYPVLGLEAVFPVERTPSQQWLAEHAFDWLVLPEQNPDRATLWSPPYIDFTGQGLLISARTPVYYGDDYRGLIGIDVSLARLEERLRNLRPTPGAYGFFINGEGQLIAAPGEKIDSLLGVDVVDEETADGSALGRSLLQSEHADLRTIVAHMQAGESGTAPVELGDEPVVIAYAPLPDVGWSLGVVAPTSDIVADAAAVAAEIERDIEDTLQATLLTIAAFSLLAMVAAVFVGRSLTRPLGSLVAGTRAITAGDLAVRLPVTSRDEFGLLASSFNEMTSELRDAYQNLEERVEARTQELATLLEVSHSLTRTLELEPLLGLILDQLKAVVDYTGASILTLEGEVLVVQERRGPVLNEVRRRHRFSIYSEIDQVIVFKRQPIIIADIRDDTPSARTFRETAGDRLDAYPHIRSWMGIPLVAREGVVGMLAFDHAVPDFYAPRHAELAMAFANQAALTIENARLFHTVQRRAEQFRVVGELGRRITSILAVDELLVQTARSIRDSFGYYHVHIGFIEGDEVVYKTGAAWDDPHFQLCESTRLKVGQEGFVGWVAATGEPLLVPDSAQDPRNVAIEGDPTRSELVLPLKIKGEVIGVLDIESDQLNAFDELDVAVLHSLASQVAVAIENARLFQAEQRRAEQFRAIGEMGRRITSLMERDHLLTEVVQLIHSSFSDYHSVSIGLIEDDELVYRVGAGPLWDDPQFNFPPKRLKVGQEGLTGWVAATGEPLLARDVSQEPRYFDRVGSQTRSELVLPIKAQSTMVGVLDIQSKQLNAFDDTDLIVLQSLADQVGVAMQNAHLFAAERRRSEQLGAINEVGRRITSILDVDKLLSQTVHMIHDAFGYYHAHIGLIEAGYVVFPAAAGVWRNEPQCYKCGLRRFQVGRDGISGHVAAAGTPLLVRDIDQDTRYVPMENGQVGSALALPLRVRGKVIGVLNVESDDLDAFDESDMSVLQSLANQVTVAIENARLYQEAGEIAALRERQRLARELHDSVSQALYGIALGTRTAVSLLARDGIEAEQAATLRQPLDYVMSLAEAGLAEMRALIFELRPESLETEGLVAALTRQTDALRARHGIEVVTSFGREPDVPLLVKEALYRVSQEALHNIVKHAQASRAEVGLATDGDRISLEIRDNGRGFDTQASFPGHLGLHSMRERIEGVGGTFQVVSEPDRGTCIRVEVMR